MIVIYCSKKVVKKNDTVNFDKNSKTNEECISVTYD